jgi:hypothetical protein
MSPRVLVQELDGEAILLDLESEHYFSLDDVGTRMWQVLAEAGDVETAVARLLREYDVDEATLRHDLGALIERQEQHGLASVTPGAGAR